MGAKTPCAATTLRPYVSDTMKAEGCSGLCLHYAVTPLSIGRLVSVAVSPHPLLGADPYLAAAFTTELFMSAPVHRSHPFHFIVPGIGKNNTLVPYLHYAHSSPTCASMGNRLV